jgi:molecular chaperone IbpA
MATIRTIDTATLANLNRALVGFDRMLNNKVSTTQSNYPPHNILKYNETNYSIELAVAGFSKEEIHVEVDQNILTITGEHIDTNDSSDWEYLHRGLASRNFLVQFPLAEYIEVIGAEVKDGLLRIELEYVVPEALKPRQIEIK